MTKEQKREYKRKYNKKYRFEHKEGIKKYNREHQDMIRGYGKKHYQSYKEVEKEESKKYYQTHKDERKKYRYGRREEIRGYKMLRRYGITLEQYNELLIQQNGVCAICLQPEITKHQSGMSKILAVDHDHDTGEIRGLLCNYCNTSLGGFRDDPTILELAKQYLLKFNQQ
jgi:hypothetical protein